MLAAVPLNLDAPGTYLYDGSLSVKGHRLNSFTLSLKDPLNREAFLADELTYLDRYGLSLGEQRLVLSRDWTGLLSSGCHLLAMLKLAATVGQSLWHIGAHNIGHPVEELFDLCPRRIYDLPGGTH